MYGTAARIGEILHIKVGHLHLDTSKPYVVLYGKGGKMRTAYLLPRVAGNIREYLREFHGTSPNPDDYLSSVHAHQFRHAKASHWLEDGINVVQVSSLLGHQNLETTMKYLDITSEAKISALATLETETERNTPRSGKSMPVLYMSF